MFDPIQYMTERGHEQLLICHDRDTGLRGAIALHNTTLGPGLGGTRLWHYDSHAAAILDVLRLSEAMTYKAAVAGLSTGGGKAVVIADGKETDPALRAARFRALGRFINGLGGQYITTEDIGTTPADMIEMKKSTPHVVGTPVEMGGSGDPSPMTAFGVMEGLRALAEDVLGADSLNGVRVSVQGLGKVGFDLARRLVDAGAHVIGTDVRPETARQAQAQLNIELVEPDAIYDVPCDIFAPCAVGAIINDRTIPRLKCKIVAGCANNQLEDEDRHGQALHELGIIYAVDYVVNAGGLINVAHELDGYDEAKARAKTAQIYHTIKRLLAASRAEGLPTHIIARRMAQQAIHSAAPKG